MRILDASSRAIALSEVRSAMSASPFLFQPDWARVIAGEEEGVFGWLSANYVRNSLLASGGVPALSNATIGALDLGGASTQITFLPPQGVDIMANAFRLGVTDTLFATVYTHSFLYYGQNEGTARINELQLVAAQSNGTNVTSGSVVPHPCFYVGTPLLSTNYTSYAAAPGITVYFEGTGNASECAALAAATMQRGAYCLTDPKPTPPAVPLPQSMGASSDGRRMAMGALPPVPVINVNASGSTCSLNGVYQAPLAPPVGAPASAQPVSFYAFSGYSRLWEFLRLPYTVPLSNMSDAVTALCGMSFAVANATYGTADNAAFLPSYCLIGSFVDALLRVGYGINASGTVVTVAASVGTPVSYATGAMLFYVNTLPWQLNMTGNTTTVVRTTVMSEDVARVAGGMGAVIALLVVGTIVGCLCCRGRSAGGLTKGGAAAAHREDGYVVTVSPTAAARASQPGVPDWSGPGSPGGVAMTAVGGGSGGATGYAPVAFVAR